MRFRDASRSDTVAPRISPDPPTTPRKSWSSISRSSPRPMAYGPTPWIVLQIARAGCHQVGDRRAGDTESDRGPDDERKQHVLERLRRRAGEGAGKYQRADGDEPGGQADGFGSFAPASEPRSGAPGQDDRRDEQVARGIAHPPRPPERSKRRPRLEPADAQTGDADRRAHGGAHQRAAHDQPERIAKPVRRVARPDEATHDKRRSDGFEGVARGDAEGHERRLVVGDVRDEGAEKHAGPRVDAQDDERGERQSGRRPDERHLIGGVRHREAEPRGNDIDRRKREQDQWPGSIGHEIARGRRAFAGGAYTIRLR